ncbi:MAG: acyl-CoA dehydrogenase family protein [Steroidobacteraceae bacterium]|nr:acyl-CoA dehydrogenase family protein [Nevskiaceae bacterium]MCP5472499.1 acyl-CoA dehydrogenase family protein [Nevskiaceae bacterium]
MGSAHELTTASYRPAATAPAGAETIVDRLVGMRAWLRDMQLESERQRRVPQATVERLAETGLYAITVPARFGGADFSARELLRIYEAAGRGCGSTAWTVWASSGGNQWSTAFPEEAVRPVYEAPWIGNRTCAVGGSSRRLAGAARRVANGWMVKGRWPFATGSLHASHAYLAVYLDDFDDTNTGMVLVPKASYRLLDDWDTTGLAGTGSVTLVIEQELFVPDERFSSPRLLAERLSELKRQGRAPRPGGVGRSIVVGSGNAIGMAEHALEVFLSNIGRRSLAYSPYATQKDAPITHLNVGQVQMQIKSARCVAEAAAADLDRLHEAGADATPADFVRYQADAAFVWDTCANAIEALFRASGASGIAKTQPLQLIARNCRAGSLHAAHNIQICMENYGRQLCGIQSTLTSTNVLERSS